MKLFMHLKSPTNLISKLFQPTYTVPKGAVVKNQDKTSKSQRLMIDLGIIKPASHGYFHFLPLGLRAVNKLIKIVDEEMVRTGSQKILLPTLTNVKLWEKTGRVESMKTELFTLKDRHNQEYILSPTHEEAITDLVASLYPISYKHFPLRLYQISSKFRDERKPRFGLLRCRQFIMKDLYTFDINIEDAKKTYQEICVSYEAIFNRLGVKYVQVLGTTGNIGGSITHEFHFPASVGEDQLMICSNCKYSANIELCENNIEICPQCKRDKNNIACFSGIEVGHTFLLGDKYSKILQANFLMPGSKPSPLQMGCYGLGISRIIAASVECLSTESEIRWPLSLAPYKSVIISPKRGSKEESKTKELVMSLYNLLEFIIEDDVILDDRNDLTIGKRFLEAKQVGYPFIIIIGKSATENPPLFELYDTQNNTTHHLTQDNLLMYIKNKCQ